jgi:isoleucyl-tRNA synthetase
MSESAAKDYKDTLNLPRTEFPMKGNLSQLEPKILAQWEAQKTFERMVDKNATGPLFVFHDGPPYANGHLHAGHALNKVLKDIVVKSRNLAGERADFVPGWDCHGLPIELAVEKKLKDKKVDRRTLSKDEFLAKCREYALEYIDIQRQEFKRMGVMARWEAPYATLSFDYEAQEIRELATFAQNGELYRKKKPVYWCIYDATALAEAEVEYDEHTSPSVYVAFDATEDLGPRWSALKGKRVSFVIWTTTPWTLPANLAIAVHPEHAYVFYELGSRVLCVAKELLANVLAEIAPDELKVKEVEVGGAKLDAASLAHPTRIIAYATGEELKGLSYRHAFIDRVSPVLSAAHVTLEQGTGLVHTAPGHGQEDYVLGLSAGLDIYSPVKNDGRYDDSVGPLLAGKRVFEANPIVVDLLVEKGALLNAKDASVSHSYPHCWRCHKPVIFRATHQWFIALDKNGLRAKALEQVDKHVNWVPHWGHDRIRGMLETRPDWCISRQRTWGVPIPIALCEKCEEPVVDAGMMKRVADAVEKEGAGVWYRTPVGDYLPAGHTCSGCGGSEFRRETDILDVWFDSACSFAAVAARRDNMHVPADLYLEGSDQHRGWFHSSLLVGVGTRGHAPYRTCLTHGFVVDGQGQKMSKSVGNVVAPEDIIKQYGAEVMRLWVASSDYRDDVRLSKTILDGLAEGYRKIRNTLRYALSNLYDFDPAKDSVPSEKWSPLDRWAEARLQTLISTVREAYKKYEFHLVYHSVVDFCAQDLSAIYFDILKDGLYTSKKTGPKRRSAQTVLYRIAREMLLALAPITSFTSEEAWSFLPGERAASVFLGEFASAPVPRDEGLMQRYAKLFAVRSAVLPLLEAARRDKLIGKSLEAKLVLSGKGEARALLELHAKELPELFIVSQVEFAATAGAKAQALVGPSFLTDGESLSAEIMSADGQRCPRCWTYNKEVGAQELCNRCQDALS